MKVLLSRWRRRCLGLGRRLILLALLIAIAYAVRPIFWTPLDYRFYDLFQASWRVPAWEHVVIIGIDHHTRKTALEPPVYPLSRHVERHAQVLRNLQAAGARAIVLDLTLSEYELPMAPPELTAAIAACETVYLVSYLEETGLLSTEGASRQHSGVRSPLPELVEAADSRAFLADVTLDPDGTLRRFAPDPRSAKFGVMTLPEGVTKQRLLRPLPIVFPSPQRPLPQISYSTALRASGDTLAMVRGKIAFIGQVEDVLSDFVAVPTLQDQGGGLLLRGLPGVKALAAVTETMLRGRPLRDASALQTLLWNLLWSAPAVLWLPRRHPWLTLLALVGGMVVAVSVTGALHALFGLIFPAGLLAGCVFVTGGYVVIASYVAAAKENARVQADLRLARVTQEALLPKEHPQIPGWDIWGRNISSLAVSGDYFDIIELGDGRPLWIVIADVSGKGTPAALLMATMHGTLHSHVRRGGDDPVQVAVVLDRHIRELIEHSYKENQNGTGTKKKRGKGNEPDLEATSVTAFLATLDPATGRLHYVNAAHVPPLLVTPAGTASELGRGGLALGWPLDKEYKDGVVALRPDDVLCLCTDGVTEAKRWKDRFEMSRLKEAVIDSRAGSSQQIGERILERVQAFSRREPPEDDLTLVVVKRSAPEATATPAEAR